MGLDMYLKAKIYISASDYKERVKNPNPLYTKIIKALDAANYVSKDDGISINLTIGYWRKVNAIHNWFMTTLADGSDECQEIPVSRSSLENLLAVCKKVLKASKNPDKAAALLPPTEGFFFGSTEVDEDYFQGIRDTVTILERAIGSPYDSFIYQASW